MSLTTLFERITKKQRQRQNARASDYRSLVAEIADGKEPAAERIERLLTEAGKNVEELQADVELLHRRRGLRAEYDALDSLQQKRREAEDAIGRAEAVLSAAEAEYEQTTTPLIARLEEIKTAMRAGNAAREQLLETCRDSHLVEELAQARDCQKSANVRRSELQLRIKDARDRAVSDLQEIKHAHTTGREEALRERAKDLTDQADAMDNELVEVLRQLETLSQCERAVQERMLAP